MDAEKMLDELIGELCAERGEPVPGLPAGDKANCFRALCNVRPPAPVSEKFLKIQDEYLSACAAARGTVSADGLVRNCNVALWRGDITRLEADAIVNACNCTLLGCFYPLHGCVDNVIHSCAGVQVRLDCAAMMRGRSELNGRVRVTRAYNLPCGYIFHTVGPIVRGAVTAENERDLADCYLSCLSKADEMGLKTLAFCCISTGEYRFPNERAAEIATDTVRSYLAGTGSPLRVIFDVFKEKDHDIYEKLLAEDR